MSTFQRISQWNVNSPFQVVILATTLILALHTQLFGAPPAANLNVLIIGSTADSGDRLGGSSDPFLPTAIASELDSILSGAGLGTVNVQVEERYDSAVATAGVKSRQTYCYNLASWFHWPYPEGVETATRWPNLRGETTPWDYVILIGDPYTIETTPGMYALGVGKIGEEVAKGSAETILLMPWPAQSSGSSVGHYKEVVYRAGRTGGYKVAPAALAWQADGSQTGATHPSARGAYICAASIYSRIWNQSASTSSYTYNDTLADLVHTTVTANVGQPQYSGIKMNFQNPFLMLGDKRRDVHFSEKGTSTEQGYKGKAVNALDRARVSYDHTSYCDRYSDNTPEDDGLGWPTGNPMPIAWNHGRPPSSIHIKGWVVNPDYWQLGLGFVYQAYYGNKADWEATTTEELNDWTVAMMYAHDISYANDNDHHTTFRCVAARTLWAQIHQVYPGERATRDRQHNSYSADHAVGTYMYTLYSGRCPLDPMPRTMTVNWHAQRAGYETAWRLGTCSSRAPGFKVMPSAKTALTVTPSTTETMTVQFLFPPRNDVTVQISSSDTSAAVVGTQTLVFTPTNYNVPQSITVAGVDGTTASAPFSIDFATISDDPAYDALSDSWAYTTTRTITSVTHVDNGTTQYTTPKNFPVTTNLNASGANSANTVFAGPGYGTLSWSGSNVVYTPDTDYVGPDGFAYYSNNGSVVTTGYIHIDVIDGYPDGSVRVEAIDSTATEEGTTTGAWSIIRQGSTASDLTVNFTLAGTATDGSDYNLSDSSPITIPSGQSAITITLTPIDDSVFGEHTETATLTIATGAGYTAITSPATIGIADNDNNPPTVDAGPDQTVALNPGTSPSVVVGLNGTVADPEDTPATVWMLASSTPSGLSVAFANASAIDTTATFTAAGTYVLRLTANDGYGEVYDECIITVSDPTLLPAISVTATDAAAAEAGQDTGAWTVSRTGDTTDPLIVNFTLGGTATETTDYTIDVTSPVTIPAGETSITVTLTPVDDAEKETAEVASLVITPDAAYTVGAAEDIAIADDDNNPPVVDAGPDQTIPLGEDAFWTPDNIPTAAWYDASDVPTITESGGAVSQWNDKSGNANHMKQATASNRPITGTRTVNGLNAIAFDGSNDWMQEDSNAFGATINDAFVFMVVNRDGAEDRREGLIALNSVNPNEWEALTWLWDSPEAMFRFYSNGSEMSRRSYIPNLQGQTTLFGFCDSTTNNEKQIWINAANEQQGVSGGATTTNEGMKLGQVNGTGTTFDGLMGEVVIINGTVTADIREKLEGYLAHKWGFEAMLPAGHPYLGAPPSAPGTVVNLNGTVTDADPIDSPSTIWTVVSTVPADLPVTFADASAIDTTASFTAEGVYTLRLTADDGTDVVYDECVITVGTGGSQIVDIALPAGISLYGYTGENPIGAQAAFQTLIDNSQLSLVRWVNPTNGQIKELYYTTFPSPGWVNEIGDLTLGQGYVVKTTAACTLSVSGNKSTASVSLDLPAGYSIIGFNKETPVDAQTAFQSLIDAGKLELVRWVDPANGQIKELYYTTYPSAAWVNEIGDLTEAQGYIIKLNGAHTGFTLP